MASHFGVPDFPDALEVKGVTVDAMRRYAEAARTFYECAPWRLLSDRDLIEIRGGAPQGMNYATVLGMGGSAEGLGFFDDKTAFWNVASGEAVIGGKRGARGLWSLVYDSIARLPMSEGALWVDHELPVAGPKAYPLTRDAGRVSLRHPDLLIEPTTSPYLSYWNPRRLKSLLAGKFFWMRAPSSVLISCFTKNGRSFPTLRLRSSKRFPRTS